MTPVDGADFGVGGLVDARVDGVDGCESGSGVERFAILGEVDVGQFRGCFGVEDLDAVQTNF